MKFIKSEMHPGRGFRPLFVAAIVFFVVAVGATGLIWRLELYRLQEERARITDIADDHAHLLHYQLERTMSACYALAVLVRHGNGSVNNFNTYAHQMIPYYPGVTALELVPGGVIRQIAPLSGNEKAIGFDLFDSPTRAKEAQIARDTGKLTIAGPFELVQGGMGAVARLPVFLNDAKGKPYFWGFTAVLLHFPETLVPARLSKLAEFGLSYELWRIPPDTGKRQVISTSSGHLDRAVEIPIQVANSTWMLSVAPIKGWGNPVRLSLNAAIGLLFSLLLAWLAKLLTESKAHEVWLEVLVDERTSEIRENVERLRMLENNLPDSYVYQYLHEADGTPRFVHLSEGVERLHGVSRLDVLRDAGILHRQIDPEQLPALAAAEAASLRNMTDFEMELRMCCLDGEWRWLKVHSRPRLCPDGQVLWDGLATDVTEKKLAETRLRNFNRTQALRSSISQTIVHMPKPQELFDAVCRIAVEQGGFRMAWIGMLDMRTKHVTPVSHAGEVGDYLDKLNIDLDDSERSRGPTATSLRTGKHVVANNIVSDPRMAPWRDDALRMGYQAAANFPFIVAGEVRGSLTLYAGEPDFFNDDELKLLDELAADITYALEFVALDEKRQQAEESTRKLNDELEQRVRERTIQLEAVNKELETFSYSVSHDLKAPLRGIDGYSRLLEADYGDRLADDGRLFIRNIRDGATQMNELIDDLLNYSRMERSSMQSISLDLQSLVQAVASEQAQEIEQTGVQLCLEVPPLKVRANRDGFATVVRNLLANAIKFSRSALPPTVEIGAHVEGEKVILWVRDNGIGFDMKYHDRIFEIFQRLQRTENYPGTGIGLALVRKAMQRIGGRVWAESAPGKGATFFVEIPHEN